MGRGVSVLADASTALALSVHTLQVHLGIYGVGACERTESGEDMPSWYLALAGKPAMIIAYTTYIRHFGLSSS